MLPKRNRPRTTANINSLAVVRSGIKHRSGEWVVTTGYSNGGKLGYFIMLETYHPRKSIYTYSNVHSFTVKENDNTFRDVIIRFKEFTASKK